MQQSGIKDALLRASALFVKKPALAQSTQHTRTILTNGLVCVSTEGDWTLKTDMSAELGGGANEPSPGVYARAALGSCLATSYAMWAAKLDISIDSIEVNLESDSDSAGLLGTSDVRAGHSDIRFHVEIKSTADEAVIAQLLDVAEQHCPVLDIFARPVRCNRQSLTVVG